MRTPPTNFPRARSTWSRFIRKHESRIAGSVNQLPHTLSQFAAASPSAMVIRLATRTLLQFSRPSTTELQWPDPDDFCAGK
jgi:hypothetical protein